jgi:hypothetical protein
MKVRNNDIYAAAGEYVPVSFAVYNSDGSPYILPPNNGTSAFLAFTIKSGVYNTIVLEKYVNLQKVIPDYNDYLDYSSGGYNKFTSQKIVELGTDILTLDRAKADVENGDILVYHSKIDGVDVYQHLGHSSEDSDSAAIMPYTFEVHVKLDYYDTYKFAIQNYTYDIILYMGTPADTLTTEDLQKDTLTTFPLGYISLKRKLLGPKLFVVEATNNV